MMSRSLTIALCAAACGDVAVAPGDADIGGQTTTYKGRLETTPPVTFGGLPFCDYTMTLQQLDVELAITASGGVASGKVQNLNLEGLVPVEPPCENGTLPPLIATYTFASAQPAVDGLMLTFVGAASNDPVVELSGTLTSAGAMKSATLRFRRIYDDEPLLAWSVVATVPLVAQ